MKKIIAIALAASLSAVTLLADAAPRQPVHSAQTGKHGANKAVAAKAPAAKSAGPKKKQPALKAQTKKSPAKASAPKASAHKAQAKHAPMKATQANKAAKPRPGKKGVAAKAPRTHRLH